MGINRNAVKRTLGERTKAFIEDNIQALEAFLHPTIHGFASELEGLEGPRGRVLERSFHEARTSWEKFFWVALGRHWVQNDLDLEIAVQHAEDDLLSLSSVLETVVVLETLAVTEKVKALRAYQTRGPSVTRPLLDEEDLEAEMTLDPTEEVDMEHPRVCGPIPGVPMIQVRCTGPEDTTVVEGLRGRPKL